MTTRWRAGEIADATLWLAIILAPVAGASSSLYMLPVLTVIVSVAFGAAILDHRRDGHRVYLFGLPIALTLIALFTLLQVVPLSEGLLGVVSPRARDLRTFIAGSGAGPISYEPAASAREAAKLLLYAMVALTAADRVRLRKSYELVAAPVVIAGMASLGVAAVQRMVSADRMLGILPSMKSPSTLLTTFVNANHASAFMLLVSLAAVGQSLIDVQRSGRRMLYATAGVAAALASALCFSRGGLGALVGSYALALVILFFRRAKGTAEDLTRAGLIVGVTILVAAIGVVFQYDALQHAFAATDADPLGVSAKLAAVKDSIPLVLDHKWFGIGRGAYVSVYPAYKTAELQLTFTHPENIAAEAIADWGVVVGALALLGWVVSILRRLQHATSPAVIMVLTGILVITGQNLVDFNLELPGMAIPVAALLGAATPRALVLERIWPKRKRLLRALILGPVVVAVVATVLAFALGDLGMHADRFELALHQRRLDRTTKASDRSAPRVEVPTWDELAAAARWHPANPVMAAQLSYLAETATPPDRPKAVQWANRTLYLAPTYADGHLAVGRLLIGAGHREQGFEQLRRGWTLSISNDARLPHVIRHVVALAKTVDELRDAIPRRDDELDQVDDAQLAECIFELQNVGKTEWANQLLQTVRPAHLDPEAALPVARAAMMLGELGIASQAVEARLASKPDDAAASALLVELLWKENDTVHMNQVVDRMLARRDVDPTPFLEIRVRSAIQSGELDDAQKALDQLMRRMAPTVANQVELAQLEALLSIKGNLPDRALRALERAIQLAPGNTGLRIQRAELLIKVGRITEARSDLEAILRSEPGNNQARAMIGKLKMPRPVFPRSTDD